MILGNVARQHCMCRNDSSLGQGQRHVFEQNMDCPSSIHGNSGVYRCTPISIKDGHLETIKEGEGPGYEECMTYN